MLEPRLTLFAGVLLLAACSSGAGVEYPTDAPTDTGFCTTALEAAERQLDGFRNAYPNPAEIPRSYEDNQVRMVAASDWTSGFPAGSFWQMYEFTGDTAWREAAEQWTAVLEDQKHNTGTHDLGFMMFNSFGNGLRLANLADYELVLIQSAESLLTRYNATVGATRSWDFGERSFPVIVDNMMNLELLYFASAASNDAKYAEAATSHASTTLDNHFRPDHSSYHVVDFDPATGAVVSKQTEQGIADESAWSRGQAWGLYGFTMVYRYTRDRQFLDQAQNIADFFLDHPNLPEDRVPYFDFDAPDYPGFEGTRDSSAAAIAASALLELSGQVEEPRASRYRSEALEMLRSLASSAYLAQVGGNGHFLLKHATGHKPAGSEVDVAINYADYYYLEALLRCTRLDD